MYNKDLHRVKDCRIGQRVLPDHSGVYGTLKLDSRQRKTWWKLNIGMLNDPCFKSVMEAELDTYFQDKDNREVNPSILWDTAKAVLRGKVIGRMSVLKKMKAQNLLRLQEKLRDLEQVHIANKESSIIH